MKNQYAISELLKLRIKGLPNARRTLEVYVKKQNWEYVEVASSGRGGIRREYILPESLHAAVVEKKQKIATAENLKQISTVCETDSESKAPLKNWQKDVAVARLSIVHVVRQCMTDGNRKTYCVERLIDDAANDALEPFVAELLKKANARGNSTRKLSRRTLFDWVQAVEMAESKGTAAMVALAPKAIKTEAMPAWAAIFVKAMAQPQNPSLAAVVDALPNMLPAGVKAPSYATARRFWLSMGNVEREKGRMGSRELKNIKPFIRRDTTDLHASDCYSADGHTFDAEVAHPLTGKPFRPEITMVIDVATRVIVGWSIALAESTWAVLDALRMAACEFGIPALFYVDNGSGYENAIISADGIGLMATLGTTKTNALPYNSQAKGIIERPHRTIWVNAAKKLPTYMGKDMDAEAKTKVFKRTRKDIKLFGRSKLLLEWADFMRFCTDEIAAYNHKPHRGLSKSRDPHTLKLRHLTPMEAWQRSVQTSGKDLVLVLPHEQDMLFRPRCRRQVRRGEVELFGNRYFSHDLTEYHGDEMTVEYDIHAPEHIWVRNDDGRLVAKAVWNANKRAFFAKSVVEQAVERRAAGQMRRLNAKQKEVLEQLNPLQVIEHVQAQTLPSQQVLDKAAVLEKLHALPDVQTNPTHAFGHTGMPARAKPLQFVDVTDATGDNNSHVVMEEPPVRWLRLAHVSLEGGVLDSEDMNFLTLFAKSKRFKALAQHDDEMRVCAEQLNLLCGYCDWFCVLPTLANHIEPTRYFLRLKAKFKTKSEMMMMDIDVNVNNKTGGGIAAVANVAQCYQTIVRTQERHSLLSGIAAFYGPSGFGKSVAASYVAIKTRSFYVQAKSTQTKKSFMQAVLKEMSIAPATTLSAMVDQAAGELAKSGRPLIVDEFDYMVSGGKVELVRDLYEGSQGTILIIGEERLPIKLEKWERFHGRVLNWTPALPATLDDARLLAEIYSPNVAVADDVLTVLVALVKGSTRRLSNNLEMLHEAAMEQGVSAVHMSQLKSILPNGFVTGESPKPRSF